MRSWFSDFSSWIDVRLGLSEIRSALTSNFAPDARSKPYLFFEAFILVLVIQLITGVSLALYYVPSADHAHTTIEWIQKEVNGGAFIRSMHHWSATILLVLLGLHLTQVFLSQGRKSRDELIWMFGGVLFLLVLGFAATGGLLPWDQNAYFSTRRLVGTFKPGTITLSRFYTAHTMVLPGLAFLFILLHYMAARKSRVQTWAVYRSIVSITAVTVLAAVAITRPALLEPNANPADLQYVSHPNWYFLPFLHLVKIFGGTSALGPTMVVVSMCALLLAVPFLQRKVASIGLAAILLLSGASFFSAKHDEMAVETRGRLDREAFLAVQEAAKPFEPDQIGTNGTIVRDRIPPVPRQFAACAECHGDLGGGGMIGPDLINVAKKYDSPERLEAVLLDPQAYGVAVGQMPRFTDDRMPAFERKALIQYLTSLPRN